MERVHSAAIFEQSCSLIPGGVNSPIRSFPGLQQLPVVAESGHGEFLVDADGKSYIDFCGSWGALIHGHAHPKIVHAAAERLKKGSSFGMTTSSETRLAAYIIALMPHIEKIRFVSTGTEAAMSAVRLARGYTGRKLILKFIGNYHGHADPFLTKGGSGLIHFGSDASSLGVPAESVQYTLSLSYNHLEEVKEVFSRYGDQIAAVIVEPVAANMGVVPPVADFLKLLRQKTAQTGSLLIFDEVICGFRVGLSGASAYFDIQPDLTCLGKIIGGGFPAAAFGGKREIMDLLAPLGPVYQAGTLSGNPVAMDAGYQALSLCQATHFYKNLKEKTDLITEPLREIIKKKGLNLAVQQVESMFTLFFGKKEVIDLQDALECNQKQFSSFFQRVFQKGILLAPSQFEANFVSSAHTEASLTYTRDCILDALLAI